jgi:hypothetical protein
LPFLEGDMHDSAFPARHGIQRNGAASFAGLLRCGKGRLLQTFLADFPVAVTIQTNPASFNFVSEHEVEKVFQRSKRRSVFSQKNILILSPDFKDVLFLISRFYGSSHILRHILEEGPSHEHFPGSHGADLVCILFTKKTEKLLPLIYKFYDQILRRKRQTNRSFLKRFL